MKKIMIALAVLGMAWCHAEAQTNGCKTDVKKMKTHKVAHLTQRSHTTNLANAYQVCREHDGYYTCCVYKKTATATATSW